MEGKMIKWLLCIIFIILAGCQSRPRNYHERYRQNPEAYHEAIMLLYEQIQKNRMFVFIDPDTVNEEGKAK